jgi:hypothetical protein
MLIDAEIRHQEHPDTFEIPDREVREGLQVGDFAKVIFDTGERLWLEVMKVGAVGMMKPGFDWYVGAIRNEPVTLAQSYGDWVGFHPRHVIEARRLRQD